MHIIIDGYNLIRQSGKLKHFERQSLEAGRRALIHRIALYRAKRGHRMTIVFDGREGDSPEEERDVESGVLIIYSRRGETADEVIKRLARRGDEETIVVTSDRNLAAHIGRHGGIAISSAEFEARLEATGTAGAMPESGEDDPEAMRLAKGTKKKGPAWRLSRREKTALARIKKL